MYGVVTQQMFCTGRYAIYFVEVSAMPDRVGPQLGNNHLLRLLGRGGFAEVYLGEHLYLKRRAALKILHTSLEDDAK
jgi:hypothetical protein